MRRLHHDPGEVLAKSAFAVAAFLQPAIGRAFEDGNDVVARVYVIDTALVAQVAVTSPEATKALFVLTILAAPVFGLGVAVTLGGAAYGATRARLLPPGGRRPEHIREPVRTVPHSLTPAPNSTVHAGIDNRRS